MGGITFCRLPMKTPLALLASLFVALTVHAADPKRPNIVFIFSDDHAYQAISAYGESRKLLETPNIDRIAKRRHALRPLPRAQLDLRPEPGDDPDRQVQSHLNGFYNNSNSRVRRLADDLSEAAAGGRLPDGDHRQVAPRQRSDRLRLLAHPAGPGRLLQPADDPQGRAGQAGPATPPTSSPTSRSTG